MCSICAQVSQNFQIFQIFSPPLVIVYFFNTPGSIPGGIGYFLLGTIPNCPRFDSRWQWLLLSFFENLKEWTNPYYKAERVYFIYKIYIYR